MICLSRLSMPFQSCLTRLTRTYRYTPIGGHDQSQPIPYDPSTSIPTQIRASFARSLKNLRTEWLDSYLLHSPLDTPDRTKEAWSTLCDSKKEGVVRLIGVSNTYDVETLQMLQPLGKVDVVQNRWYEGNAWDHEVHKYCREQGIHYESAKAPLSPGTPLISFIIDLFGHCPVAHLYSAIHWC
jgi:aryl-alcohol dehydrogenase-like predicted oxidoreductase